MPDPAPNPAAPVPPPAPGAAPAPAADIAAMVAAAVKAQLAPVLADRDAALASAAESKAALEKANQGVATTAAKAATAEEQIARLRSQFGESQSKQALSLAVGRYQYASPEHREAALVHFRAECAIKAEDSGDVVATIGGKQKPVPAAFDEWFAVKGSIYKAAVAQPGPGVPASAPASGAPAKRVKDMTPEEFAAHCASGVRGTLTNDRNSPVFEISRKGNHWDAKLKATIASVTGRNGQHK